MCVETNKTSQKTKSNQILPGRLKPTPNSIINHIFNNYLLFLLFIDFGLLHYSCGVVFIMASVTSSLQMAALFGSSNVFDRCWCSYIG